MRDIEISEAVEATQLSLRNSPEAGVGEVKPGEVAEAAQSSGLDAETEVRLRVRVSVEAEVGQPREAGQTGGRQRGQLAVRDLEVLEAGEVGEAAVIQPRHVVHKLGACNGQGQGARDRDHREVGLVILRVDSSVNKYNLFEFVEDVSLFLKHT